MEDSRTLEKIYNNINAVAHIYSAFVELIITCIRFAALKDSLLRKTKHKKSPGHEIHIFKVCGYGRLR